MKVMVNQKGDALLAGLDGHYDDAVLDMTDQEVLEKLGLADCIAKVLKQRLVDGRARYTKLRTGSKVRRDGTQETPGIDHKAAADEMLTWTYPVDTRPGETLSSFDKMVNAVNGERTKKGMAVLTPAQIANLQLMYGITVENGRDTTTTEDE